MLLFCLLHCDDALEEKKEYERITSIQISLV